MRTTLNLDDDVLEIARSLASRRQQSLGKVISDTFRNGIQPVGPEPIRNGIRVIQHPAEASPVTLDLVNQLRDDPSPAFSVPIPSSPPIA